MVLRDRSWSFVQLGLSLLVAAAPGCSEEGQGARAAVPAQQPAVHAERPASNPGSDGGTASRATPHDDDAATPEHAGTAASRDAAVAADARSPVADVLALHRQAIVVDTHNDVTLRLVDQPDFDFFVRHDDGHTDLPRMIEGGLDAEFFSVWVKPRDFPGEQAWERSMAMFDAIHKTALAHPDKVVVATTAADVRAAAAKGKTAFLIGVEGAHALGAFGSEQKALDRIKQWYDRGARYITLTWMNSNALGGSSGDNGRTKGLTELGRKAVATMNDLGMVVDVSHVSDPTFDEAVKLSRLPVLASHSGVRALNDHYRNLTDDMLRAIAKNGGAACIVYYPGFLDGEWAAARRRAKRSGGEMQAEPVKLSKLVDHIMHAVEVAGVDHVCLGSDFDGIGDTPVGLEDVSKLPNLTAALRDRGLSDEDIVKILGANVLRVLEANERGAKVSQ